MTNAANDEPPIDPARPIVDAHHHFWDYPVKPGRFLLHDLLQIMTGSGHRFTHTVYAECHSMYRREGPEELRPVGETEFVNGIAAMSASGMYGTCRIADGIVGSANLLLGDAVTPVLEAHLAAGGGRFRGVRMHTAWADAPLFGHPSDPALRHVLREPRFAAGARALGRLGLVLDVWAIHPQLPDVIALAGACPGTTIVLDHYGTPLDFGAYAHRKREVFDEWRAHLAALARLPNVVVKLGGFGMDLTVPICTHEGNAASAALAPQWRPYIDVCVSAFGAARCLFESNFPPDRAACPYGALWNAYKLATAGCSEDEKDALFSATARRVYRLS